MPKQRRTSSRPIRSKTATPPAAPALPVPPAWRSAYLEALALYEQGVAALQAHDYPRASTALRSVLSRYPDEKELHERVRLYLNVCDRHMAPGVGSPSTPDERVFAATLAVNAGNHGDALEHLRRASAEAPDHDLALYLLASVLALRNQVDEAVPVLLRAIELNPDNRALARHDPDLEPLRRIERVRVAIEASIPPKTERRKTFRRSRQ